jgi:hypothetical protein
MICALPASPGDGPRLLVHGTSLMLLMVPWGGGWYFSVMRAAASLGVATNWVE